MLANNFYLSQKLGLALKAQGLVLTVAESCTGGGLATQITAVPNSSQWFDRGFVTYSDLSKVELLGVSKATIEQYGAVSEETAIEMVKGALQHSHADLALSITGIAGPGGGTHDKPVGTVWFALLRSTFSVKTHSLLLAGGRKQIRQDAIGFALSWLLTDLGLNADA